MAQNQISRPSKVGLTSEEAAESLRKHGLNILTPPQREPWWKQFLEKFNDPVIRILIIAAAMAIAAGSIHGEYLEGIGIVCAILLATSLAFVNEYRAGKEFDILNTVNDEVPVKVIRNGQYASIPRKNVVIGDAVLLETGEEVPADGEVLEATSLLIDESRLTGESAPVVKLPATDAAPSEESTYPSNCLMRGTMVAEGNCVARVVAVGDATEIGKTARAASEVSGGATPLTRQLERLSKVIGVAGFAIAALLFIALIFRGLQSGDLTLDSREWAVCGVAMVAAHFALAKVWMPVLYDGFELFGRKFKRPNFLVAQGFLPWAKCLFAGLLIGAAGMGILIGSGFVGKDPAQWISVADASQFLKYFMVAVTVIVVAVPEGLAMSVTLSLAYSMRKMTASNTLVRRMNACETIGAATIVCTDKTGTLTLGEMRVNDLFFPAVDLKNVPAAEALAGKNAPALLAVQAFAANSTANLTDESGKPTAVLGNPTEGALLLWLKSKQIDYKDCRAAFQTTRQWPFKTEVKAMGTLGKGPANSTLVLHVKGAPEILLERCTKILTKAGIEPLAPELLSIRRELEKQQSRAMRTLAFAYREVPDASGVDDLGAAAHDLIWLGFVALADPLREDVRGAVQTCLKAGIEVTILTGDVSVTAKEIGRQIGLITSENTDAQHITGTDFAKLDDAQVAARAPELRIISRARPMDKMRLVKALKQRGEIVAVTGDGTNDAPALNAADVGLSMGKTGTAVAKEASDIILLDDSFNSIVSAVMWGRSLYLNIQRFISFQLTINVTALGIALMGPFIGIQLPLTVIQMLWVNLIMDTFAALALATEPPNWDVMKSKPRDAAAFIVTPAMLKGILGVGFAFLAILTSMLLYMQRPSVSPDQQQYEQTAFYAIFVLLQFWNLFNARVMGLTQSAFKGILENKSFLVIAVAIVAGQVLITQFGGKVFRTTPLSIRDWLLIVGATSIVLFAGELWRLVSKLTSKRV